MGMIQCHNSEIGFACWLSNKVNDDVNKPMQMLNDNN